MLKGYKESLEKAIPDNWEIGILSDVSEIKFSNVDKITSSDEAPILLCNYLDVYNNEYVDDRIEFMPATATDKEIEKFALKKGDVIITKDSETPDDTAKPAVVVQDLTNVLCGYHLALIRPDLQRVDSVFLGKMLSSKIINHQFERLAQGLTRFGLEVSSIKNALITIPPRQEQRKIAAILSTVDETIEKTDAIIEEAQQLKKGLMQKLFMNKAFMVLRKAKEEKTDLKPIAIHELGEIVTGTTPSTTVREYYDNPEYMFIGPADIGQSKRIVKSANYISKEGFAVSRQLPYNAVMVVGIGATIGKVGITSEPCTTNQQINTIIPNTREFPADYVYYLLVSISDYVSAFAGQAATPIMNKGEFGKMLTFIHPTLEKRQKIADILSEVDAKIETEQAFRAELEQLKKGLMQVLLTGKVRVKV